MKFKKFYWILEKINSVNLGIVGMSLFDFLSKTDSFLLKDYCQF